MTTPGGLAPEDHEERTTYLTMPAQVSPAPAGSHENEPFVLPEPLLRVPPSASALRIRPMSVHQHNHPRPAPRARLPPRKRVDQTDATRRLACVTEPWRGVADALVCQRGGAGVVAPAPGGLECVGRAFGMGGVRVRTVIPPGNVEG